MKRVKVTLTYVADVDDEVTADMVHERIEDYIDQEIRMDLYDELGEDSWLIPLKLEQFKTSKGAQQIISVQKT